MAIAVGQPYKVYFESSEGTLMEMSAQAVTINYYHDTLPYWGSDSATKDYFPTGFSIELRGYGRPITREGIMERRTAPEWACSYCGRPNQRADETCKSCGAVRSFVYG